ncbi:hypothetical protein CYCD_24580 [Tenuifilaceae bacterium CYCD]|nr:hypothetical protein CYCD_24580 [Tenuifilaceae bacterium CYCD]
MGLFAIFVGLIRMSMKFRDAVVCVNEDVQSNSGMKAISIWSVVSFLMVIAIKTSRGQPFHLSPMFSFMQGTLPNFFAATGITSWAFMYYRIFPFSSSRLLPRILLASLFAFAGLTLWEVVQYFMGYAMDINDIAMTAVGCILTSVFIYLALTLTRKK